MIFLNLRSRPGVQARGGVLALTINPNLYTAPSQSSEDVEWTLAAGGQVQTGVNLGLASAEVELVSYTETTGTGLVFGKDLSINVSDPLGLGDIVDSVEGLLATTVAASAGILSSWEANAVVSGLTIEAGQEYSASFSVAAGAGLEIGALGTSSFSILNGLTPLEGTGGDDAFNLLSLALGPDSQTVTFSFIAPENMNSLTFRFAAQTVLDAELFAAPAPDQQILTFDNFSVTPVPEPSGILLVGLAGLGLLGRRRRAA